MTRTFIALEMHPAMQRVLDRTIERFALAMEATQAASQNFPAFAYRLTTPGIFGAPRQPRVIWMGIEDAPVGQLSGSPLQRLHNTLNRVLERRDFETEKRPFSPHLTLARVKHPLSPAEQQTLQRLLYSKQDGVSSTLYPANSLNVMKSELSRAGAKYSVLQAYELREV